MAEHYTLNTVSATAWCGRCNKQTMHSVADHKIGGCLECIAQTENEMASAKISQKQRRPRPKQLSFSDEHLKGL